MNPFVTVLYTKYGLRRTTIAASAIAIISTLGYGLGLGLLSLILFRILWGMAFSVLRLSTLAYAFKERNIGLSLGTSRSVQELGPMFALLAGPVLLSYFSQPMTFFYLSLLSLPGFFYATKLPDLVYKASDMNARLSHRLSVPDLITFIATFTVEGLLIVVIGMFLQKNDVQLTNWTITNLAAGYLAYRRICFIFFSPAGGVIADKVGVNRVFNASLALVCIGFVLLLSGWEAIGLVMIFTFNSVNSSISPAAASHKRKDKLNAVSTNATWRDIGAATGTLGGGLLLGSAFLLQVFLVVTFMLVAFLIINLKTENRH
jgi:MFS family permease